MNLHRVLDDFKTELRQLYGKRLQDVILFGSYARGDAWAGSDIDVMVVLAGEVSPGREIDRMIEVITDLNLKYDVLLSVVPVAEDKYRRVNSPLLLNVRREGIPA
ncbi:MAG: nucleotidyltransferase domain-containing protein [Chloroflexi bacterium]|nr:nucleotidyltransferase domain-containing protein [Chloroflexota bacterium]